MAADDLFGAAAEERLSSRAPLADRLRPRTLDDIVGQDHLVGPGKPLRVLIEADRLSSVILWGPPGTGKTTLARVIAGHTAKAFETLSAVTAGVKDVREVVGRASQRLGEHGLGTILFLDEVHRFNKAQQDALLPSVESGLLTLIGATTENPYFEVNPPLLSRSTLFRLEALDADAARDLIARALDSEGADADDDAVEHLAARANGDGRHTLTSLEVAVALAVQRANGDGGRPRVTLADAEAALGTKALRYGRDDHYDVISAFIKSIRGSDPDAGLYWLATMLEAGEDARFIARRLVILASEDVGEADPLSLLVATAAAQAVEYVGLPEAQLNLAQAVVHLAAAPKSNRVTTAIGLARRDVREVPSSGVPAHLRDAHYAGAEAIGHGDGYDYPHDHPSGWVEQQYRPDEVADHRYYDPSEHGREREIAERMATRRPTRDR
ncbi:MAG: replication-associated recombination protein A [Acidimicrobiales bacterium]|nr:replication-associated recombination protein A [Acidimicrobiales bacterium]